MDWTQDIDNVLNNIRVNALLLATKHKTRYFELKDSLKWYRLPVIVLNGANSIISVGLQSYTTQSVISITTSLIALICGIIGSIELYLGIQKRLENDSKLSGDRLCHVYCNMSVFDRTSSGGHLGSSVHYQKTNKSRRAGHDTSSPFSKHI